MTAMARQVKRLLTDPVESVFLQVPRALACIDSGRGAYCAVLFLLVNSGWDRIPAAIAAYLTGGVVQYILCSYWVFPGAPKNVATGLLTFTVLSFFGLVITWGTIAVLGRVELSLAKLVALGLAFSWNFMSRKYLLFRVQTAPNL